MRTCFLLPGALLLFAAAVSAEVPAEPSALFGESLHLANAAAAIRQKENRLQGYRELQRDIQRQRELMNYASRDNNNSSYQERMIKNLKDAIARREQELNAEKEKLRLLTAEPAERQKFLRQTAEQVAALEKKLEDLRMPLQLEEARLKDSIANPAAKRLEFSRTLEKVFRKPDWAQRREFGAFFDLASGFCRWYGAGGITVSLDLRPYRNEGRRNLLSQPMLLDKYQIFNRSRDSIGIKVNGFSLSLNRGHAPNQPAPEKLLPELVDLEMLDRLTAPPVKAPAGGKP